VISSADEARELRREVGRPSVERARRREVLLQPFDHHLAQALRLREPLQPVLAEIAQARRARQVSLDQIPGGLREEDLAAVRRPGDARRSVDIQPEVIVAAQDPLAGVHSHPDSNLDPVWPGRRGKLALGPDRRADSAARRGEHGEEGVPLGAHLAAPAFANGGTDHSVVALLHVTIPASEPLEQPCRALDVREEEGHRAGGKVPHFHSCGPKGTVPKAQGSNGRSSSLVALLTAPLSESIHASSEPVGTLEVAHKASAA
jgi:hypothetical protein